MAIFNGRYHWDGTKQGDLDPVAWYPGSYDVKIIDLRCRGKVVWLKPVLCLFSRTGEGHSISANPEKFARRICAEFSLELERVLWVEDLLVSENRYHVITFVRGGRMGQEHFYKSARRGATAAEMQIIGLALESLG